MKENHPDLRQVLRDLLEIEASVWSMARLFSPSGPSSTPLWGLLVMDDGGDLHFVSFTQKNWVSDLFTQSSEGKGPVKKHEHFRREDIRSLVPKRRNFLEKLFTPPHRYALFLKGRDEALLFELEDPADAFLNSLNQLPS